jgi:hypothetical protein
VSEKPKDLTWKVKWVSTVTLILAMILTSQNIYPYNLAFHTLGILGWTYVSIVWNDRALIVINSVGLAIFSNGIVSYFVKINVLG